MPQANPNIQPADLLRHGSFLRALARGIVRDEHRAEDLVQQAYAQALERPPRSAAALRSWLGRAVRNLALNTVRSETRRARREHAVARGEATEPDVSTRELELQRQVVDTVLALREPYRTIVHLRYYLGLSPSAIADQLGVPRKTVQSRLTRAHAKIRERLDRARGGDRRAWLALLLPAAAGRGSFVAAGPKTLGAILMAKLVLVTAAAAVVLYVAWAAWLAPAPAVTPSAPLVSHRATEYEHATPIAAPGPEAPEPVARAVVPSIVSAGADVQDDVDLKVVLERALAEIERSFSGPFDPVALLDAALLLADHETGPADPEPHPSGNLVYPLQDLPPGIGAELHVGKNRRQETVLTLHLQLERPRDPWLLEGCAYREPSAQVSTWTDADGELLHFGILTGVQPDREFPFEQVERIPSGVYLYTPMDDPTGWKLTQSGLALDPSATDSNSERTWRSTSWDVPQVLAGGPWPRTDDMQRLSRSLLSRYGEIRARSGR